MSLETSLNKYCTSLQAIDQTDKVLRWKTIVFIFMMLCKENTCLYLTSKPSLVSFVFSQLIENESPVNRYSQGTSRPQPPPLFTRLPLMTALPEFVARFRNLVSHRGHDIWREAQEFRPVSRISGTSVNNFESKWFALSFKAQWTAATDTRGGLF